MRAPSVFAIIAFAGALLSSSACELSAKVGEVRGQEAVEPPATLPSDEDASVAGPTKLSWKRHAPLVPCGIYAMAEDRSDALFLGCSGGQIYRFDGVNAQLSLEVEDTRVFSLLWAAPGGVVWAAAQSSYKANATTQVYRFDGASSWSKVGTDN